MLAGMEITIADAETAFEVLQLSSKNAVVSVLQSDRLAVSALVREEGRCRCWRVCWACYAC